MHLTHNTSECQKYGKDGIAKGLADKKRNSNKKGKELGCNYTQLTSKIEKLKKSSVAFQPARKGSTTIMNWIVVPTVNR